MHDFFETIIFYIVPLLLAIIPHEISHGLAAYALGDDTAQKAGRFKLYTHFDLWGSFLIPLGLYLMHSPFLLAYAKPVPVDVRNFKDPLKGMAMVAAAGPLYNLLAAVFSIVFLKMSTSLFFTRFLLSFSMTNLALFFFNLIPIPPLDGSRILVALAPKQLLLPFIRIEPYGFFLIMGLEALSRWISDLIGYNIGLFHLLVEKPIREIFRFLLS